MLIKNGMPLYSGTAQESAFLPAPDGTSVSAPSQTLGGLRCSARQSGARQPAIQLLVRHFRFQDSAHRDQSVDIDAGGKSLALAQEHQVLEHDVAGGARRE